MKKSKKNRTPVLLLRNSRTIKASVFMQASIEPSTETKQEKSNSPTLEELEVAKQIIARGIARAKETPARSPEKIWAEFEEVRAKIAVKVSNTKLAP